MTVQKYYAYRLSTHPLPLANGLMQKQRENIKRSGKGDVHVKRILYSIINI